jgi:hypothetical protein
MFEHLLDLILHAPEDTHDIGLQHPLKLLIIAIDER